MEMVLAASIDPIEAAFVRAGLDAALDAAAIDAVERGALTLNGRVLARAAANPPPDAFGSALFDAAESPLPWRRARAGAKLAVAGTAHALERKLVAAGLIRDDSPLRWIAGRRTADGRRWLATAKLAFPAEQVAATNPALAFALHGARALHGTRYASTRRASGGGDGSGGSGAVEGGACGSGHGGAHGCGVGGCGAGGCGGGGCGGGGCGSG